MRQKKPISNITNITGIGQKAKTDPRYKNLLMSLKTIDSTIQGFVRVIVKDVVADDKLYYTKTEFMNQCYSIYLYNSDRRVTVGKSWPLIDFIEMCQQHKIEMELNMAIRKMIIKFDEPGISTGERINWVY